MEHSESKTAVLTDNEPADGAIMTAHPCFTVDHSACDNGGKHVACDRCGDKFVCTPCRDLYCTPEGDHCCEPCLMRGAATLPHLIDAFLASLGGMEPRRISALKKS